MPTYEYECTNGHQFEAVQRITEDPLQCCQVCDAEVRRLISPSTLILKGGGWYSDGYGSGPNGSSKDNSSKAPSETSTSSSESSSDSSSSSSKSSSKSSTPDTSSGKS